MEGANAQPAYTLNKSRRSSVVPYSSSKSSYDLEKKHLATKRLSQPVIRSTDVIEKPEKKVAVTKDSNKSIPRMFIVVKYADNQSLICNPMCSIVNLLSSIKARTGNGDKDMLIDLSDETGLILDLELHGRDYANKHLSSHSTYILMEKQLLEEQDDSSLPQSALSYNYIPLLERYEELYPNFKVHLSENQKKKLKPLKNVTKSPSPAGKMAVKSINAAAKASTGRQSSRSSSRNRSSKH